MSFKRGPIPSRLSAISSSRPIRGCGRGNISSFWKPRNLRLLSEAPTNGRHHTHHPANKREERAWFCARYWIVRWHDDCRWLDDRLGDLHCGCGYFAADG